MESSKKMMRRVSHTVRRLSHGGAEKAHEVAQTGRRMSRAVNDGIESQCQEAHVWSIAPIRFMCSNGHKPI